MATDNSCIEYAKEWFRQVTPSFQFFPINFKFLPRRFTIHWRLFNTSSRIFLLSVNVYTSKPYVNFGVCMPMSLSHCVILSQLTTIESNEELGYVSRQLEHIVCWCVAVPGHNVAKVIALSHIMRNAANCVFAREH